MLLVCATVLLAGCNVPSYINVPGDGGDTAINDPNQFTVLKIEKQALAYMLIESPIRGDIVVRFPEGTTDRAAFRLSSELADFNIFPEGETPTDSFSLVEIREVSARGGLARVDIIRPGSIREREMVEVHLKWSVMDGWSPDYIRVRNIDVDRIDPLLLTAPGARPRESQPGSQQNYEEVQPLPVPENDGAAPQPAPDAAAE